VSPDGHFEITILLFFKIHNGLCVLSSTKEPDPDDMHIFFVDSFPDGRMGSKPGTMNIAQVIHV
jgi:hypothetical protein